MTVITSPMKHAKFTNAAGDSNITVLIGGELFSARDDNPNWDAIVAGVEANDPSIVDLFKPADAISRKFAELTERVSVHAGEILWDGEPIHNSLTQKIIDLMDERVEDWRPFVEFMDKLYTNPNEHSREQAFDYIAKHKHTILTNGNFLAYKGVDQGNDGVYYSRQTGNAIVDDEQLTHQQIPNKPGSVVRMPRADVLHDPLSACHVGLHVATFDFARRFIGYSGAILEVEVNPRDIVSVPYSDAKMRVCRYKVIRPVTEPSTATIAVDTPEASPVLVTGGDEIAPDEAQSELCGGIPTQEEVAAVVESLGLNADDVVPTANIADEVEAPARPLRKHYPSPDAFEQMRGRAKRRRRNFQKYATKHGWTLFGDDPDNRKHWSKGNMIEMTDTEFVDGIKARLHEKGWCTGRIGLPEGPNCLLGAAGFVAHNGDLIVDSEGIRPIKLDGKALSDEEQAVYSTIPGMVRLAGLMGLAATFDVSSVNDRSESVEEAIAAMEEAIGNV